MLKLIYEFRYYCVLPINDKKAIYQVPEIEEKREKVQRMLLTKAHEFKLVDIFSKEKEIDYQILKNIFCVRVINLEDLYIKLIKEKEAYYVQLFDENVFEEKIELEGIENIKKEDLTFKISKKVKIFD